MIILIIVLDYCFLVLTHFTSKFSPLCRLVFALFFCFILVAVVLDVVFYLFFFIFLFCHFD